MATFRERRFRPPIKNKSSRPPKLPMITARQLAYRVLMEASQTGEFAADLFDKFLTEFVITTPDRRLAAELVHGTIRRKATLDTLIQSHLMRKSDNIEHGLHWLMRLGVYQLVFLDAVPPHAAIHETVELTKSIDQPRWTGFLNAVLRSVSETITSDYRDFADDQLLPRDAVPVAEGRWRVIRREVFPDPARDLSGYLAKSFSLPEWLVSRWLERYGGAAVRKMGFWFNTPGKLCLRINSLRTTREAWLERARALRIDARPGQRPEAVWVETPGRIDELPGFHDGDFVVQDESAMSAAALLAPRPGESVLDLCAAPGGKTTHIAELMHNQGQVLATDVDEVRLQFAKETCQRLGLDIVQTKVLDRLGRGIDRQARFDAVLVDAPCSNTGVLGKRTDVRWRLNSQDLVELPAMQLQLLQTAMNHVRPGGRLVYSTCSIEPEENRNVVALFLREQPDFTFVEEISHHPGQPGDGAYQALLRRRVSTSS